MSRVSVPSDLKVVSHLRRFVQAVAEYRRSKVLHVVAACHHLAVCSCASDRHEVASYAKGQKSSCSPYVAGLADWTDDVVGL